MKIDDDNLVKISGGGISSTVLSYLSTALRTVYNIGQEFGGAIRRIATRNVCPM